MLSFHKDATQLQGGSTDEIGVLTSEVNKVRILIYKPCKVIMTILNSNKKSSLAIEKKEEQLRDTQKLLDRVEYLKKELRRESGQVFKCYAT